ncbi:ABC transporter protein [Rhodospirillum rubrum F11]|uniref:ABC transporter component n=1 Tax=Rhodospirillum rubrum (strain ATCC 11170 / ATH 1.1.1 / DSM 467 / LMG 4362 / NCIMB 8255 / S1) TaxID=269796 RepID=Q2RUR3_RHORT|nr:ABC transporter ATP-binding protein [Rhodospirillum rubrum]ABC22132.1 ABC transporter component [Rhodospirillum rubrum ATCC 11170]AEO47847.1 ABC transporter protein [Rhodospirillum rubrum F11]MBK5953721.1 ABC transporter ATP-binding protein [Rhodospirillum rubrum]QXG81781.1 energy-coupling factor ABC transporter ATP-binding protein [Rhodospirillum rubrum]
MTTIEIAAVHQRFDTFEALRGIDLMLTERRIGIVGGNGSGKSTFARLLNGLLVPTEGKVLVDGLDTARSGKAVRRKVGFVFQNPDNQIVFPVVEEDVAFGLKGLKLPKAERDALVDQVLDRFGLGALRAHSSHALSGGQKQLLALAGVLITQPDCVVFDEPTTLLDLRNARKVAGVIRDLEQSAIVVTHDLGLLADFDRVIVFENGKVSIDDRPGPALARYIGTMQ